VIHEAAGRSCSSSLASMTSGSADRQTVKFTEYIGDQIQEVCLGCRLSQFVDAVIELSHSTLAEVELKTLCEKRLHHWCEGLFMW